MSETSNKAGLFVYFIIIPIMLGSLYVVREFVSQETHDLLLLFYWLLSIIIAFLLFIFSND